MSENRLARETSPYLLQHKDNPVHWWAWGPEALAEAKRTGKPILLSVGYAACHWCHVMAHESFEDEATAALMNELFVNIKVDREERPDIDAIYMRALHSLGEQGGWPLTMFLDSDARPVLGRHLLPAGAALRPALLQARADTRSRASTARSPTRSATTPACWLRRWQSASKATPSPTSRTRRWPISPRAWSTLSTRNAAGSPARPSFRSGASSGCCGAAPSAIGDAEAKRAVDVTLTNICQGGIYDHLGGGFARYSVDERWLAPHFEKMLYDNALLIDLLCEAYRETGNGPLQSAHRGDGRLAAARDDR